MLGPERIVFTVRLSLTSSATVGTARFRLWVGYYRNGKFFGGVAYLPLDATRAEARPHVRRLAAGLTYDAARRWK